MEDSFYTAIAKVDFEGRTAVFVYKKVELLKYGDGKYHTKDLMPTSRNGGTRYFEESMLNREFNISDMETVIYTCNKETCIEWLKAKQESYINAEMNKIKLINDSVIRLE